jgi:hypothetical protein
MPVLTNPKWELFAQELAKGKTQTEAYELAGYKGDRTTASRLATNANVIARVNELLQRAANRVEISISSLTERLIRISDKSEAIAEPAGYSVARQAAMDVAKLHGLIIEKKETGKAGDFGRMNEGELDAYITREKNSLSGSHSGETASGSAPRVPKSSGLH